MGAWGPAACSTSVNERDPLRVRLADGRTGYSYVAGRDKQHAELAALPTRTYRAPEQPCIG